MFRLGYTPIGVFRHNNAMCTTVHDIRIWIRCHCAEQKIMKLGYIMLKKIPWRLSPNFNPGCFRQENMSRVTRSNLGGWIIEPLDHWPIEPFQMSCLVFYFVLQKFKKFKKINYFKKWPLGSKAAAMSHTSPGKGGTRSKRASRRSWRRPATARGHPIVPPRGSIGKGANRNKRRALPSLESISESEYLSNQDRARK